MDKQQALEVLTPHKWTTADPATGTHGNYGGEMVDGYVIATQCRDSDALDRSNFDTAATLPGVEVHRFGHWAVGWTESVILPTTATDEQHIEAARFIEALERYPVANEELFSQYEQEEAQSAWEYFSLRERVEACVRGGLSMFAARSEYVPYGDCGWVTA